MVKNWPSNAGGVGSIPGDRIEIPHEGQLSPEPQLLSLSTLEPVLRSKRSLSNTLRQKKTAHHNKDPAQPKNPAQPKKRNIT